MTDDAQDGKRLTAQRVVEHVQSNDTVELVRAWHCGLSRRLELSAGITVCASFFRVGHARALLVSRGLLSTLSRPPVSVDVPGFDDIDLSS